MEIDKRSWTEINLEQIERNYRIYKQRISGQKKIMAIVKADAYGHGDIQVSRVLQNIGVTDFAVSNADEACRLRESGIEGQILILGFTPLEEIQRLFDNDITIALVSEEYAAALSGMKIPIKCQFAIDTGMNRIGLDADDISLCEQIIRQYDRLLNLTGMFTHLCVADSRDYESVSFTNQQIHKFESLYTRVSDLNLEYVHCLNSAGGLWHKSQISCFARLGIILYGLKPDYSNDLPEGIAPALTWKSVVAMTKTVHPGETIGYGRTYAAEKDVVIATIPTGYADGYNRLLSNKGYVLINGMKAPVVGRVCMDQITVDVTDIPNVMMGTEVVLIGSSGEEHITADEMANFIGTIGYEVICGIGKRVPRFYKSFHIESTLI